MQDFTTIIYNALVSVEYSGEADNKRLLSAIQDLATDHPKEKKALQNVVDKAVLQMGSEAITCGVKQRPLLKTKVSDYLQQEYQIDEDYAKDVSKVLAEAFVFCGRQQIFVDKDMYLLIKQKVWMSLWMPTLT